MRYFKKSNLRGWISFISLLAIFLSLFLFRLWDLEATGMVWDEYYYRLGGTSYIKNIANSNFDSKAWGVNMEHPPIAKYIYGLAYYYINADEYLWGRILSVLMGVLTCWVVYLIGKNFFEKKIGVLAALILGFLPPFIAHTRVATLESPTALFWTLTIYFFFKALRKKGNNKNYLFSAIFSGLALGTKLNGFILVVLIPFLFFFYKKAELWKKREVSLPLDMLFFPIIPLLILYLSWPWLWSNPYEQFLRTLNHWTYKNYEYFLGKVVEPPLYYFVIYFLVTTPFLLLLSVFGFGDRLRRSKNNFLPLLIPWFAFPFIWSFSAFKQDGIRYIIAIYPPLSLISAIGCFHLVDLVKKNRFLKRSLSCLVPSGMVIYLILTSLSIHPYYLDYYNELVGGPEKVYEKRWFEIGWWCEGLKEATDYLNKNAEFGASIQFEVPFEGSIPPMRDDLIYGKLVGEGIRSDYIVESTSQRWYPPGGPDLAFYREDYTVKAKEAPLIKIYKIKSEHRSPIKPFDYRGKDWIWHEAEFFSFVVAPPHVKDGKEGASDLFCLGNRWGGSKLDVVFYPIYVDKIAQANFVLRYAQGAPSPTSFDIYIDDKLVGSSPTLILPPTGGWGDRESDWSFQEVSLGTLTAGEHRIKICSKKDGNDSNFDGFYIYDKEAFIFVKKGPQGNLLERRTYLESIQAIDSHNLEMRIEKTLNKSWRNPESLEVKISPYSSKETLKGQFQEIIIQTQGVEINELLVDNLSLIFQNVNLDIGKLCWENELIISERKEIEASLKINSEDISNLILENNPNIKDFHLKFEGRRIKARGKLRLLGIKTKAFLEGELEIVKGGEVNLKASKFKIFGVNIPQFILQFLSRKANPIFKIKLSYLPDNLNLKVVGIENNLLLISN
jgi:4-amino-4-deoxy-L-arabinose transferase-like glycosyltransferase